MPDRILTAQQVVQIATGASISTRDLARSHERLREQRDEGMKREADFITKWAAAEDRLARVTALLDHCKQRQRYISTGELEDALAAVEEPAE